MKNRIKTPIISCLIPGLGQAIEGEVQRGIFILFITSVIDFTLMFLLQWWILIPFWHAFVVYDAYKIAATKEKEAESEYETIEEEEESYVKLSEEIEQL